MRKYSDHQIVKILVLLQIFHISDSSADIFLRNHKEYAQLIEVKDIPSIQRIEIMTK